MAYSSDTMDDYQKLFSLIKEKAPVDSSRYSDPRELMLLPFPFRGRKPTDRFTIGDDKSFGYMGREEFARILSEIETLNYERGFSLMYIYGTIGYGKSHILAAMACYLLQKGFRVVYLPDCRILIADPLTYIKSALLLTFGDCPTIQEEIIRCSSVQDIKSFCKKVTEGLLYFIIDQINALDLEDDNKDRITNEEKKQVSRDLAEITFSHHRITSASANHQSAKHVSQKQMSEIKYGLLGGLTEVRMSFAKW